MKPTRLKGILHDLANHLGFEITCYSEKEFLKNFKFPFDKDILNSEDEMSKYCINFIKKRAPKNFDINEIKEIQLKITREISPEKQVTFIEFLANIEDKKPVTFKVIITRIDDIFNMTSQYTQ